MSTFNHRFNPTRWVVLALLVLGLLIVGLVYPSAAAPPAQSPEEGQAIFQQKCIACHTIGGGPLVGPDLQRVVARRDRSWLVRMIAEPDKLLAEDDPLVRELLEEFNNVPMPNPGLSEAQVAAVLAYLEAQAEGPSQAQPAPTPTPALPAGDPRGGEGLFTGATPFQNEGPPCMACHSIAGIGALGGGTLGPDLTKTFDKYGEAGLPSVLAALPFPLMSPIYKDRPLTTDEQGHLMAFFQEVSETAPAQPTGQLGLLAAGGFLVLIVLVQVVWRRRLQGVRRSLVEQTQSRRIAK